LISLCVTDLGRMYQLVSRIQDGLGELKSLLEAHIYNQGVAAIDKCGDAVRGLQEGLKSKCNNVWAQLFKT